ncbi:MAG: TerC family protein [Micrococcales bacterium]|nr:TerC family protein [Micrococcales bacterium]
METSLGLWLGVIALILVMLAIDLIAHRKASVISIKEAAIWSSIWVATGVLFGVYVWVEFGSEFGQEYFSGFVIEKSLAIDNVFVWALIFAAFAVPREFQHRVLFLGVLGALVFRGIFIAGGAVLIQNYSWVLYPFAAFLIVTGVRLMIQRNQHIDPTKSRFLIWFHRRFRSTDKFYHQKLVIRKNGVLYATPLLAVLAMVEFTDIIFAVDSIPAIFAVTDEAFLVFTANAFAILGLRAMYFLLADLMHRFIYLKVGLSVLLVWVGVKMALHDVYKIPTTLSLTIIILVIGTAITASLLKTKSQAAVARVEPKAVYELASQAELASLEPIIRRRK